MPAGHLPVNLLFDFSILLILAGLGLRLTSSIFPDRGAASFLVATGVGLYLFSTSIFILTALGFLKLKIVATILGFFFLIGLNTLLHLGKKSSFDVLKATFSDNPLQRFEVVLIFLLLVAVMSNLLFGYAPPTGEDELHYHISLPALFVYWGRWVKTPGVCSSFFPLNGELVYTGVLLFRDVLAVKAMVWCSGLLLATSLYVFARRYVLLARFEALFAVVLLYTCPMMSSYHGITSVDMLNLFFEIIGVIVLWEWRKNKDLKLLVLMGVLGGAGMGTRMYAAPWVLAITLFIAIVENRPLDACCFGGIAAIVFSPWWIRNYLETGNPVYPWALWNGAASDPYQMGMLSEKVNLLKRWFTLPFFISTGGFIWGAGPLPWSLIPFSIFRKDLGKNLRPIAILGLGVLFFLHLVPGVATSARYYDAALPWTVILAAAGFGAILSHYAGLVRKLAKVWIVSLLLLPNIALSVGFGMQRLPYLVGRQSEDEYLKKHYSGHEGFEMFHYMRTHCSPSETILHLGDLPNTSAFYFPAHHIIPLSQFAPDFYTRCSTTSQFAKALKEKGVDEVLFIPYSFEPQGDGSWRFLQVSNVRMRVPPLVGPYFKKIFETADAVLYSVTLPR
jgi:hypothetical protein